jgi:hypothetical protein
MQGNMAAVVWNSHPPYFSISAWAGLGLWVCKSLTMAEFLSFIKVQC